MIYEKLSFSKKEETKEKSVENDKFVLKETVVNNKSLFASQSSVPGEYVTVDTESSEHSEKENNVENTEKPRKKTAMFADSVEKISSEGEKETSQLQSQSPKEKEKMRPSKPQGKKKFGAANTVFVSEQDQAAECKQQ